MKKRIIQLILGTAIFLLCLILFQIVKIDIFILELSLYLTAFLILGYNVLIKAARNIMRGRIFDENFLMSVASIGAFCISEFPEAVAVMLFYQAGELFQSMAVGKSRRLVSQLMDIRPDYANLYLDANNVIKTSPENVKISQLILIKPGEKIPLDGCIVSGDSYLDTCALTGESRPKRVSVGDEVLSGSINLEGVLTVKTTKSFGESTASKILELVENASAKKSKSENFITKFAKVYTPLVILFAALLATIPPIFAGNFLVWLYRGLTFLVVSCPCALVVSVPMSFFGGIGGASRQGVLVKGGSYLEALAKIETVVFDKTGTLTKGTFSVTKICSVGISEKELLRITAFAESYSNHPISLSLKNAYGGEINTDSVSDFSEVSGHGIKARVGNKTVLAGNKRLLESEGINVSTFFASQPNINTEEGTIVYVAIDGSFSGYIVISDSIKEDSTKAIAALKSEGVKSTVMLTGDRDNVGQAVAKSLKIDKVYTELLPDGKVRIMEEILSKKTKNRTVAFVGDGINDAPVLSRADIGIAMGGLGSDAAIEAADVVIMNDSLNKIAGGIKIAKKTVKIAKQNIIFALGIKAIVLALSAFGYANMWLAVFADVGVAFLAILNALRTLSAKNNKKEAGKGAFKS